MRKIFMLPIAFFSLAISLVSCTKQSFQNPPPAAPGETIHAKVSPGQTYTLDISAYGNVTITQQAVHSSLSAITPNESGVVVYKYSPQDGFTGSDEVLLYTSRVVSGGTGTGGCGNGGYSGNNTSSVQNKYLSVKFTVAN